MFTAQHYQAIADTLRDQRATITTNGHRQMHRRITLALADMFAKDNQRFDHDAFLTAAGFAGRNQDGE